MLGLRKNDVVEKTSMKISILRNPAIPPLAWCCTIQRGSEDIRVECGESVEAGEDFFFEGAWAGKFAEGGFLDNTCCGTGGHLSESGLVLTPPDHILDRLFLFAETDTVTVSNSLAMLLARTGGELISRRADYPVLYGNIRHGLQNARTPLPLKHGRHIEAWAWYHMHIGPDLEISQKEKDRHKDLPDYTAYVSHLSDQVGQVFANACDPARRRQYSPLGTISSGYDSTAISVIALDHGCTEAITFGKTRAKLGKPSEDDSGAKAAQSLGLSVTKYDRLGYRSQKGYPEIETLGAGAEMSSARDQISGRVFLTGYMGDTMWDREPKAQSDNIYWPVIAGHNFTELRLAADFVHFCVPFICCRQQADVIAISQSEEMAPWRLNNDYDRPIARRIAEERNIPRGSFGIRKRATGVFFREEGLAATMTPQSYDDYAHFRLIQTGVPLWRARLTDSWIKLARFANSAFSKATVKINKATGMQLRPPALSATPGISSEGAVLFQWAVSHLILRYPPPDT